MWWSEWWNSYPDLLRLWSLFPFSRRDVLITSSMRAPLPGNRLLSTCRLCYRGNRTTGGKSGTQSWLPPNSDQLTSGVNIMALLEIRQVRNFFCTWTQTLKDAYSESTLFYNVSAVLMACVRFGLCMRVSLSMCIQASYLPYFIPTCFHCLGRGWSVLHWSGFKCCCERNVRGEGSWG